MRDRTDHYDAELLLRLYDLRRETKLREAREWFLKQFQPDSLHDVQRQVATGSKEDDFLRMVLSYWDMAACIVNEGLIKEEFFFENTNEFWIVWMKVKHVVPAIRELWKNPYLFKHLEDLAEKFEKWMAKRAPAALETLRQRLPELSAKKTPP